MYTKILIGVKKKKKKKNNGMLRCLCWLVRSSLEDLEAEPADWTANSPRKAAM